MNIIHEKVYIKENNMKLYFLYKEHEDEKGRERSHKKR